MSIFQENPQYAEMREAGVSNEDMAIYSNINEALAMSRRSKAVSSVKAKLDRLSSETEEIFSRVCDERTIFYVDSLHQAKQAADGAISSLEEIKDKIECVMRHTTQIELLNGEV